MFNVSGKELLRRRNGDTELHERIVSGERGNGNNCDRLLVVCFQVAKEHHAKQNQLLLPILPTATAHNSADLNFSPMKVKKTAPSSEELFFLL